MTCDSICRPQRVGIIMHREFLRSVFRLLLLTLLFSGSAVYEATHVSAIYSSDVWWHLRTGIWILQSHSIPRTGLFSQFSNLPWIDSSWGYEVLLGAAYKVIGLRAIPILLMGLKVALAVVTFLLARAGGANFCTAIVLSAVAQYAILGLQPLPSVFSILLFAVELQLLVHSRRSGTVRSLFLLPLMFVLWANLHIQFAAGVALLGLFLIAIYLEHLLSSLGVTWVSDPILPLPLTKVGSVAVFSVLGTFATPYSFHLFPAVFKTLYSDVSFQYFAEMRPMSFRRSQEFVLMLLVMAAFFALGRRRSLDVFELITLVTGTVLAFRIQRDAWLAVLPAIPILADGLNLERRGGESSNSMAPGWEQALAAVLAMTLFVAAALRLPDRNALMNKISQSFPVKACDFILENHLPQPLFNAYSWGGFLTWYMPQYPVAVDGRVELYGDEILTMYFKVTGGSERLEVDPRLAGAGTLLLERQSAMAKALTTLPKLSSQYRLLYSDDVATVFVPQ